MTPTAEKRRKEFYNALLANVPASPDADFKLICQAWVDVSQADWAYLWLSNSDAGQFELTAFAAKDQREEEDRSVVLAKRTAPAKTSIAMYCCKTGKPAFADDLSWTMEFDGREHLVTSRAALEALGCTALECVPCFKPASSTNKHTDTPIADIISLHWRDDSPRIIHAEDGLINMGRLTSLAIRNSQTSEQRQILIRLNNLAQSYLTRPGKRPADIRTEYMSKLIDLIKQRLNVRSVSIFYQRPFTKEIECIATTGLTDESGVVIPRERVNQVSYRGFEGLTGSCFGSAEQILSPNPKHDKRYLGKYHEKRDVPATDGADPLLLTPIPPPPDDEKPALGVIRCLEHVSPVFHGELCHFESLELSTMRFIAHQVGPVLQMFSQYIERERSISIVKHDLYAPILMIGDTIESIIRKQKEGLAGGPHDYDDIRSCAYMAAKLVSLLDPDPHSTGKLDRQPTLLEGDIVARLRDMLRRYARVPKKMRIDFDGFRSIPRLAIDRGQVERAIYNVLINAIKYGKPESTIKIQATDTKTAYRVDISNYGIGILDEEVEQIFVQGFRGNRASITAQGLGLGLGIARQIMLAHGGDVVLQSLNNPTTFSLLFPYELSLSKMEKRNDW